MTTDDDATVERLTKRIADRGQLIEAGWQGFRLVVLPTNASAIQVTEMRKAFFAGSQHLFASIMSFLEDGEDPTPADLQRMELIHKELEMFQAELRREIAQQRGSEG